MKLISSALRNPITVVVSIMAIVFFSWLAIRNSKIDIFPRLGLPTVYVAQPYGGLSPEQMEGFISSYYEYHFLYITGVKYVQSKNIQGAALLKIEFNEGTDMSQAMAEVVGYVNRARAFMPPGTVPPFITRWDAGSVPVGQLVFSSDTRSLGEISDLALFRVRPMFATLPGVSAPPPFGGNQKTVLITIDPARLRAYNLSPDQVVQALAKFNTITPAGNVRIGDTTYITPQNSVIEDLKDLQNTPLQLGSGPSIYIRDIATVSLGADVTTGYALINGKRSVYIPVTKRADASTWDVVQRVKAALPDMQAAIPPDIRVSYEFDQSGYVIHSLKSLLFEGGLGAILTGLMVLLFLGDIRSALIVILTIPLALLSSVTALYLMGQTINIMTLGGLALSVGILVDEATVTMENIHRHQEMGKPDRRAIADACKEIAAPKLLILLSMLAVFVPALFMNGIPRAMFLPLSMAVGFAMIASFLLSQTFVPVIANWLLRQRPTTKDTKFFGRFKNWYIRNGRKLQDKYVLPTCLFILGGIALTIFLYTATGSDLFPATDSGQAQVRLRLPAGTRFERTEDATRKLLQLSDSIAGAGQVEITSAYVGTQPSSYPVNYIHLWTSGPQESITRIKLRKGSIPIAIFREKLRAAVAGQMPQAQISFEPGDIVEQVLNLGSTNPIEIAVVDRNLAEGQKIAGQLVQKLKAIDALRDVQMATPMNYPAIRLDVDRVKAGQLGISGDQVARSAVTATSSSRFTTPSYWLDKTTGTAYQVQVQYPEFRMNSMGALEMIPVSSGPGNTHYLNEVADLKQTTMPGEYDRLNQQRYLTITANIYKKDMGAAYKEVQAAIASLGKLPAGSKILLRGQYELLQDTLGNLGFGLLIAVVVIFLTMTIYFQSFRTAFVLLSLTPAVIAGSLLLLLLTGHSLNIQSYMGILMAAGVSIANGVLFITQAEQARKEAHPYPHLHAAGARLRPILMTSAAMIMGMIPLALGLMEGGDQTAPLGIAVIGGLLFSTLSVLFFLPPVYHWIVGKKAFKNLSLDPDHIITTLLLLPLFFLWSSCGNPGGGSPASQSAAPSRDTAAAFILHPDTLKKSVELPAELIPYQRAELFAKVQGFVRTMKVDIGARVQKGQTLAIIEAPEVATKLEEMQASLQAAKARYAGSKDNYLRLYRAAQAPTPGIVAPVDLERSHDQMLADSAAYEASRKQVQASREVSGYLQIIAPFAGVITARQADAGALVGTTTALLTIQDNKKLRLRMAVPEAYTASPGASHTITFRVEAYPDRTFPATLARKSETIDPSTRTEQWEFEVDNSHQELKSGSFAYAQFNLRRTGQSFLVPPSAIATTQEKKFVIRVKNDKAEWIDVGQGITTDKGVEIFGRLAAGDTLLTKATDERKPGATAFWKVR